MWLDELGLTIQSVICLQNINKLQNYGTALLIFRQMFTLFRMRIWCKTDFLGNMYVPSLQNYWWSIECKTGVGPTININGRTFDQMENGNWMFVSIRDLCYSWPGSATAFGFRLQLCELAFSFWLDKESCQLTYKGGPLHYTVLLL